MRVLRLHAAGDLRMHEEPEPDPRSGEELVRITAVGICGSDLHWFEDAGIGDCQLDRPLVLGHEMAGVVAAAWVSRLLSHFLFGVTARDLLTYGVICSLLLFVCIAACAIPARRAARVEPMRVLREE